MNINTTESSQIEKLPHELSYYSVQICNFSMNSACSNDELSNSTSKIRQQKIISKYPKSDIIQSASCPVSLSILADK